MLVRKKILKAMLLNLNCEILDSDMVHRLSYHTLIAIPQLGGIDFKYEHEHAQFNDILLSPEVFRYILTETSRIFLY